MKYLLVVHDTTVIKEYIKLDFQVEAKLKYVFQYRTSHNRGVDGKERQNYSYSHSEEKSTTVGITHQPDKFLFSCKLLC